MRRSKTHEEFVAEVLELEGDAYKLLGNYSKAITKIVFEHVECGFQFLMSPNKFLSGNRCPKCRGNYMKSQEEFIQDVRGAIGDLYEVIGEYTGNKNKVKVKHLECGHIWNATPATITCRKSGCPKCAGNMKKTQAQFLSDVKKILGKQYEVLDEYKSYASKIKVRHVECNRVYITTPASIYRGNLCNLCSRSKKKTTSEFSEEVTCVSRGRYELMGEYSTAHIKTAFKHIDCGKTYLATPHKFLNGNRCPHCRQSKGEVSISDWLIRKGITYVTQESIYIQGRKQPLRLDFFVRGVAIEYDGEQHYKPIEAWGGETELIKIQRRDDIKTKYCADNNIPLIRIPYWEYDNIDAILTEKLLPLLYNADKHNAS